MRALLPLLSVALLVGSFAEGATHQSRAQAASQNQPGLRLTASIDSSAPEQQPILIVHIWNQSGHELRLPDPPLLCKPAPGALSLNIRFFPANGGKARRPGECGLQVDSSNLQDIRERARDWVAIQPGQAYVVRRPLSMGVDAIPAGIYKFRVVYSGPSASESDQEKLKAAGIAAPEGEFQSPILTYKVRAPKP